MSKKRSYQTVHSIILFGGEEIVLTVDDANSAEFWEEFMFATKTHGFYYIGNWDCVKATYMGRLLDNINMRQIVGIR